MITSDETSENACTHVAGYERARFALSEVHRVDEVKDIRDKAMAMREYARQAKDGQLIEYATEIKFRAERRAGQLLAEMAERGERESAGRPDNSNTALPLSKPATLADLGVTKMQSSRWQKLAELDEDDFEAKTEAAKKQAVSSVEGSAKRAAKTVDVQDRRDEADANGCTVADLKSLVDAGRKFGCIYADPPWLYDNQGTRAATSNHYDGLTVDELCALPIGDLAADDAHLHLWTTNGFLFDCARIISAWGFEFRSSFIWVKPQIGIGNYWRNSHEILLTAIRGDAKRFSDKSLKSWIECDRGAHSAKPEIIRHMIEKASPGPFLELFGRSPADGWTVWGNQIERGLLHQHIGEFSA